MLLNSPNLSEVQITSAKTKYLVTLYFADIVDLSQVYMEYR
jgi:hypothetical protein